MRCPVRVHTGGNRAKPPQARKACRTATAGRKSVLCMKSAEFGSIGSQTIPCQASAGRHLIQKKFAPAATLSSSPTSATKSTHCRPRTCRNPSAQGCQYGLGDCDFLLLYSQHYALRLTWLSELLILTGNVGRRLYTHLNSSRSRNLHSSSCPMDNTRHLPLLPLLPRLSTGHQSIASATPRPTLSRLLLGHPKRM
jgi:hypothetical protein